MFTFAHPDCQLGLLLTQSISLGQGLFLTAQQIGLVNDMAGLVAARSLVELDESTLLAHFNLDCSCLATGIGLLDFAGRLARQRDLLAVDACGAMRCAQMGQQTFLVGFVHYIIGRCLVDASCLQLLKQRTR